MAGRITNMATGKVVEGITNASGSKLKKITNMASGKVIEFGPNFPTWADATDEELLDIINKLDAGEITVEDTGWQVGDTRTVHLSAMSAIGVGESHVEQDAEFVLMDTTLTGLTPNDTNKPLHFIVGMKNCLKEGGYMNSTDTTGGGWRDSKRRTWCNNVFVNSLSSTFKQCFRQFKWQTGRGGLSSGLYETTDLFALPTEKQIFGATSYSQTDEANLYTQWEWYQTPANRIKEIDGSTVSWWECSPRSGDSNNFCRVYLGGNAVYYYASGPLGLSPFGCI